MPFYCLNIVAQKRFFLFDNKDQKTSRMEEDWRHGVLQPNQKLGWRRSAISAKLS